MKKNMKPKKHLSDLEEKAPIQWEESKSIEQEKLDEIATNVENIIQKEIKLEDIVVIYEDRETLLNKTLELKFFRLSKNPFQSENLQSHFTPITEAMAAIDHTNELDVVRELSIVSKFGTVLKYSLMASDFYRERFRKIVTSEETPCDEFGAVVDRSVPPCVRMTEKEFDTFLNLQTELFYNIPTNES